MALSCFVDESIHYSGCFYLATGWHVLQGDRKLEWPAMLSLLEGILCCIVGISQKNDLLLEHIDLFLHLGHLGHHQSSELDLQACILHRR